METPPPLRETCASAHRKKVFPDVQWEPPVFVFVPTASGPVTGHHWKEPGSVLFTSSVQVFAYIEKIPPEPSLLPAEQSQLSQAFIMGRMLQTPHCFRGPLLDSLQYVHVFISMDNPELDTVHQVWPHQC